MAQIDIDAILTDINTNQGDYDLENLNTNVYTYEKTLLLNQFKKKNDKLGIKIEILRLKYKEFKRWSDTFNLIIIILSSVITLLESIKAELDLSKLVFFRLAPICFSTAIALFATIIRFRKWNEKMEKISKCVENGIGTLFLIKQLKGELYMCDTGEELERIRRKFVDDIQVRINDSEKEITTNLKFIDLVKHMKNYQYYQIRFKDDDAFYQYHQKKIDDKIEGIDELVENHESYELETLKHETRLCRLWKYITCCCEKPKPSKNPNWPEIEKEFDLPPPTPQK